MICNNLKIGENGNLYFANKDTVELSNKYGTPLYLADEDKIREKCRIYSTASKQYLPEGSFALYAGKALCIKYLYKIMNEEGMGIDVVSSGEIYTAFVAGFPMERAFFHGNNKTAEDVEFAIEKGVGYFICDNVEELKLIDATAKKHGIKQNVILRLSPGIDPHTHAKISTGQVDSKFGVAIETGDAAEFTKLALSFENVSLCGFHCHVGSQIFDTAPFTDAAKIMLQFISWAKTELNYTTKFLNIGGGMGVRYTENDPEIDYAANIKMIGDVVKSECDRLGIKTPAILQEPGRSIVADAGLTLYTVGSIKEIPQVRNYVSIDGGMTDNPRYALYEAPYTVINAGKASEKADYTCTVAGRCCESGDIIQENVKIAKPVAGDTLAILTTGAYNYSMSSNYNCIPKPPIVMLSGGKEIVAVRRQTFDDMLSCQE